MGRDVRGGLVFRTKGDANPVADPWRFRLTRPEQARARFSVPYVGFVLAALGVRELRILLIGLPALLIGLGWAIVLWRDPAPRKVTA
jgi:signal peptidase I